MNTPGFRAPVLASFWLFLACWYSPWGWGVTHPPFPLGNFLLSLGFFGAVLLADWRSIQRVWRMDGFAIWIALAFQSILLIATAVFGGALLTMQWSSAHYQGIANDEGRLYALFALAGILVLEFISGKGAKKPGADIPASTESGS